MKRISLFLSAILFSAASSLLAASYVDNPDGEGTSFISPTVGHYQYKEPLMKITGPSYGLALGYQYVAKNNLVWLLQGEASVVNGKYDGYLMEKHSTLKPYNFAHDPSDIVALSFSLG